MIEYNEDTYYGQAILNLLGEVAELQDPNKPYTKKEVLTHLRCIKNWAFDLERRVRYEPADSQYFTGGME